MFMRKKFYLYADLKNPISEIIRMKARNFFTKEQKQTIVGAIKEAEKCTSGEICLHVEMHCHGDAMARAERIFCKLGMHKTELRNGVLFYMAVGDRQFAILGDSGINQKVPEDFWNNIKNRMTELFMQGLFTEGVVEGIRMAGEQLKVHFPYQVDDVNELSDEISFD